jgi:hypothetical protein
MAKAAADSICWDSYYLELYDNKQEEKERHQLLLEAGSKARAAIEEFLNGAEED